MATNDAVNVGLSGVTGSGNFVGSTSPTLVTPALGTPSSGLLTSCTGLLVAGGGTGLSSATAYAVLCGGTTSTGAFQSVSSVGTSGQVLTSNGAGALPTFQTAGAGSGSLINVQVFTSSGTYTPTSGMSNCIIVCIGGGGAGGGNSVTLGNAGSGGGSGGYSQSYVSAATIGASQTATVGTGGTGVSASTGNNGNATSIGTIVIANGGSGGIPVSSLGGAGATIGTGNITTPGNAGLGISGSVGGMGAGSFLGGSTLGVNAKGAGNNAVANSGAGGSGSTNASSTGAEAGGNGGSGLIIIYEYK
jgi:hypothetical protein